MHACMAFSVCALSLFLGSLGAIQVAAEVTNSAVRPLQHGWGHRVQMCACDKCISGLSISVARSGLSISVAKRCPAHLTLLMLRGGTRSMGPDEKGTMEWASRLGMGGSMKHRRRKNGIRVGGSADKDAEAGTPDALQDGISKAITAKEEQLQNLLRELEKGRSTDGAGDQREDEESEEVDLAVQLAPLSKEELEEMIGHLVAQVPHMGERVLELARRPYDVGAIPYRVQQLSLARASPEEFVEAMMPLAEKAHAYAVAGDLTNARAMAETLTRSVAESYPEPDDQGHLTALWTPIECAWDEVCRKVGTQNAGEHKALRVLLTRMQARVQGYGPLFSDALRSLRRAAGAGTGAYLRSKGCMQGAGRGGDFFGLNRIGKSGKKAAARAARPATLAAKTRSK